jgi:hypothetical protein
LEALVRQLCEGGQRQERVRERLRLADAANVDDEAAGSRVERERCWVGEQRLASLASCGPRAMRTFR